MGEKQNPPTLHGSINLFTLKKIRHISILDDKIGSGVKVKRNQSRRRVMFDFKI
jgi:hypothetical protein